VITTNFHLNQYWYKAISLFLTLSLTILSTSVEAQENQFISTLKPQQSPSKTSKPNNNNQEPIDFSGTGRPGQQTAGESRGDCPQVNTPLTALLPISNWGKTTAEYPNFWFYVPYTSSQNTAEFVLQDENRHDIYRTSVALNTKSGYLNVSLPDTKSPLKVGKWYRWYFKIYCNSEQSATPLFVQGWVQRIPSNSLLQLELENSNQREDLIYAKYGVWYDAVDHLVRLHLFNPNNSSLRQDWRELLTTRGVNLNLP
jgi:hypothetical protein